MQKASLTTYTQPTLKCTMKTDRFMLFVLLNVIYCLIVTKQKHYNTTQPQNAKQSHKFEQDNVSE